MLSPQSQESHETKHWSRDIMHFKYNPVILAQWAFEPKFQICKTKSYLDQAESVT